MVENRHEGSFVRWQSTTIGSFGVGMMIATLVVAAAALLRLSQ